MKLLGHRGRRYLRNILTSLTLIVALAYAPLASAASSSGSDYPIWEGLWQGLNMTFGGSTQSSQQPNSQPSSQQSGSHSTQQSGSYAALGDSVAAGVGLATPAQVPTDYQRCGRTTGAYPYIVAERSGRSLNHIACSGATVGDLFTKQRSGSPNLPAQLDTAYSSGIPQLITITAGANDAHWVQLITACYNYDCSTESYTTLANAYLVSLQVKLHAAFSGIELRNGQPPVTIITGYYNPVSSACTAQYSQVTSQEINWLTAEVTALNQTIRDAAAQYPFVTYVPVNFSGHDICSSNPWVQDPGDPRPFHPTATGQRQIAEAILTALP